MTSVTILSLSLIRSFTQSISLTSGAVAQSEVCLLGMQVALSSIHTSGTFFCGDLVMKTLLRPFSLFRWFKKSSCQLLAKECAQSTGKLPRRLTQEQCDKGNWPRLKWPKMCWRAVKQKSSQIPKISLTWKSRIIMIKKTTQRNHYAIFALLLKVSMFGYWPFPCFSLFPSISWYLMPEVLFSSLQFKFAQCHTWVMKNNRILDASFHVMQQWTI